MFPPVYILVAEKDTLIPPEHSYRLYNALRSAGVECHLEVFANADHGFTSGPAVSSWPDDGSYWTQILRALDFAVEKARS